MDPQAIERAGEYFNNARNTIKALDPEDLPEECRPRTADEGHQVLAVHLNKARQSISGDVTGYKIGLVSSVQRDFIGGTEALGFNSPLYAGVLSGRIFTGSTTVPFEQTISPFIEGEFAVRMGKDVPLDGAPYTKESIGEYVEACMAGIELVDPRLNFMKFPKPWGPLFIADDGGNWGLLIGEGVTNWRDYDMAAAKCTLTKNGEVIAEGVGADLLGHPFEVLAWQANDMIGRGETLKAGDVSLLGSVTPSYTDIAPNDELVCAWDVIGSCSVKYVGELPAQMGAALQKD